MKLLYTIFILILCIDAFPQTHSNDSLALIDSTYVTYYSAAFDSISLNSAKVIDTSTFYANDFYSIDRNRTIYSSLSNIGLAQKSMRFDYSKQIGFDMELPSYSSYIKTGNNINNYISVLPYSEVKYVMTTNNQEQRLNVKFGRQFAPRFFVSFGFNTDISKGNFKNCKTNNNYFWINAQYSSKNQRYSILAHWYRNKLEMQENGGIVHDEDYSSHTESDNNVINTNLTTATNYVKVSGFGLEQYFNLSKSPIIENKIDSLQLYDSLYIVDSLNQNLQNTNENYSTPKISLGRISHKLSYQKNQLFYNESSPNVNFYSSFDTLLNNTKTTDTTIVRSFVNELKWNNLGYKKYDNNIPFYFYAGIEQGFYSVKQYDYSDVKLGESKNFNQLCINGGVILNLFNSTRVTGKAKFIALGYQIGDFNIQGEWDQYIGTKSKNMGKITFYADIKRQSANWFESSYTSNHFRWENSFNAATYLNFEVSYQYKFFSVGAKQTSINNLIYFGTDAKPNQFNGFCSIREAYGNFHRKIHRFEFDGFVSLQKASNAEVVHLPLFLGKFKVAYSQPVFHQAATLQPSISVQYFTKYYADAYMPALRTFYLQNEVLIGNYPFIDLAMTIKVKKANIYVAYTNMFLLTGNYMSFIAPHYPMKDSKVYIGINWRLFN